MIEKYDLTKSTSAHDASTVARVISASNVGVAENLVLILRIIPSPRHLLLDFNLSGRCNMTKHRSLAYTSEDRGDAGVELGGRIQAQRL